MKNIFRTIQTIKICYFSLLVLYSCSRPDDFSANQNVSIMKISPAYESLVRENSEFFGQVVPIYESEEEMDSILSRIASSTWIDAVTLVDHYNINNEDMNNYLLYLETMEWAFGRDDYYSVLENFEGEDNDIIVAEERLLSLLEEDDYLAHKVFSIDTINYDEYVISPAIILDRAILRNDEDLFICGDSVYKIVYGEEFIISIEDYVYDYDNINQTILSFADSHYNIFPMTPYSTRYKRFERHDYATVGNNRYKLLVVFKTNYHVVLFSRDGEHMDINNRVWVKNYKKGTCIYWPTKFPTEGYVSFCLTWDTNALPPASYATEDRTINVTGNYAIKEFKMEFPFVYSGIPVPIDDYWINAIEINVDNERNRIAESFSYQWQ